MKRPIAALGLFAFLSACGVDGAPSRPVPDAPTTGIAVTGEARMGVVKE